jgi:O-acetyl-ADP-ribose deacetylase (regulator of RNase III)
MITYRTGDIFAEEVDALVNPVNCVGVMGAGLALQFKKRWPRYFSDYAADCAAGQIVYPGHIHWNRNQWQSGRDVFILSFPTKRHWKDRSKFEDIQSGLISLAGLLERHPEMTSVAMPAIGCGLGGLPWPTVKGMIQFELSHLTDKQIYVYEPQ